jgi:serine O-acetyltransferase
MSDHQTGRVVHDDPAVGGVSATLPDWERERCLRFWDPGRQLLRSIRRYQRWRRRGPVGRWLGRYWVLCHRFWCAVSGADIPLTCQIEGGLLLPHPNGVVIHPDARVGPNCLIFQQVTLGNGGPIPGAPVLGGHVDVGAGAKILGGVRVGDHARIGANAVVLQDVPAGATAVGIPARIIPAASHPGAESGAG